MNAQAGVTRRAFLAISAASGALAAMGWWTADTLDISQYPPSPWSHFDARLAAVFQQFAKIWLPQDSTQFPTPDAVPYMQSLNNAWGGLPTHVAQPVTQATAAFEMAAVVYGGYAVPFSTLNATDARAYVQRWAEGLGQQKALIAAFRQLVCVSYWRHEDCWPATGYAGPLHLRVQIPALGDAPEPVRV